LLYIKYDFMDEPVSKLDEVQAKLFYESI